MTQKEMDALVSTLDDDELSDLIGACVSTHRIYCPNWYTYDHVIGNGVDITEDQFTMLMIEYSDRLISDTEEDMLALQEVLENALEEEQEENEGEEERT